MGTLSRSWVSNPQAEEAGRLKWRMCWHLRNPSRTWTDACGDIIQVRMHFLINNGVLSDCGGMAIFWGGMSEMDRNRNSALPNASVGLLGMWQWPKVQNSKQSVSTEWHYTVQSATNMHAFFSNTGKSLKYNAKTFRHQCYSHERDNH